MRREQLEHVLRAASQIVGERDILVVGSQAVLASIPDERLPIEATTSIEADLALVDDPGDEKADRIDGAIGELSRFHETFGYYGHGVGVGTAILPDGWQGRLVTLDTPGTAPGRGLCLDPHDCVIAKLIAGRSKDEAFAEALLGAGLVDRDLLVARLGVVPGLESGIRARTERWLARRGGRPEASR
jgi:hypothetical protein